MKNHIDITIEDYDYPLPTGNIAQFPLEKRDHSRLLIFDGNNLRQDVFYHIQQYIPAKSLLIFNDTKVVHARLLFQKETGTTIEIFCLEPDGAELQTAFQQKGNCKWKCLVGNNKRWKSGNLYINNANAVLSAQKILQEGENFTIRFLWKPDHLCFSDILEQFGKVPLPPYINRDSTSNDDIRYQTVYAKHEGSVAAPTAGLHFTESVLKQLIDSGIAIQNLTLHVGAGTFKPVKTKSIKDHEMHTEHFVVKKELLTSIANHINERKRIIPVGTTSLRTIESLYWLGVKTMLKPGEDLFLDQWEPYSLKKTNISPGDSFAALLARITKIQTDYLHGSTRMIIVPGYDFKIADGIITNFHQPRSTLLLLVAAMIGDKWKEAYNYALENNFRFLSYGDCCFFLKNIYFPIFLPAV